MSDLMDKILFALKEQPNLSTQHLQSLTETKKDTIQKALKRMRERKLVVPKPLPGVNWRGIIYSWKMTEEKTPSLKEQNYKHDFKVFDIYVALRKTGLPMTWTARSTQKDGFRFDASFTIYGKQFYLEVERGTQGIKDIDQKVKAYLKLPGRFYTIFTVEDYKPNPFAQIEKTAKDYGMEILDYLEETRRGNQFVVSPHVLLSTQPLNPVLLSPTGETLTLETIE